MIVIPLYLIILGVGLYFILKSLAPEFNLKLPNLKFKFPTINLPTFGRPKLIKDVSADVNVKPLSQAPKSQAVAEVKIDFPQPEVHSTDSKLDLILSEKNNEIVLLKEELQSKKRQCDDFDKLKDILDEEIARLREQNRSLKSELSLYSPTSSIKTN